MYVKLFLGLIAALLATFGAIALADPIGMTASLGMDVSGPNGAYELRGVYGGVSLAGAALCAAGSLNASLRAPALWFLVTYMGGYVFARAVALLLGPPPTSSYIVFIAFEVIVLSGAWASLRVSGKR